MATRGRLTFPWGRSRKLLNIFMDQPRKKPVALDNRSAPESHERRRIGRIVHDDRGNASLDWRDAPSDYKRQVLEIEQEEAPRGTLSIKTAPRTFNPYERSALPEPKKSAPPKKDLKKLSEWIKMMRDLEERKRKGE
jgi:hypothetical protein